MNNKIQQQTKSSHSYEQILRAALKKDLKKFMQSPLIQSKVYNQRVQSAFYRLAGYVIWSKVELPFFCELKRFLQDTSPDELGYNGTSLGPMDCKVIFVTISVFLVFKELLSEEKQSNKDAVFYFFDDKILHRNKLLQSFSTSLCLHHILQKALSQIEWNLLDMQLKIENLFSKTKKMFLANQEISEEHKLLEERASLSFRKI